MSEPRIAKDTVLTIPNIISLLRLAGIPLFVWLLLVPHADFWAFVILIASAVSDWLDGVLARRLNQVSALGRLLDPVADRLYIIATLGAFVIRDMVPLWFAAAIIGRDLVLALIVPVLRRYGYNPLQVNMAGKAATLFLLAAFPGFLLIHVSMPDGFGFIHEVVRPLAWALGLWGVALYWASAVLYLRQAWGLVGEARRRAPA